MVGMILLLGMIPEVVRCDVRVTGGGGPGVSELLAEGVQKC